MTEPDAESAAWTGLSVLGSPILPIYISFFLSTVTRETVQSANAVTAASKSGIPSIRVRSRGIVQIFSVKNLTASQKEGAGPMVFPLQHGHPAR